MPPKKAKKPRKGRVARSVAEKKKASKQKQKQKQVVNVQVSSGGGGTSGFIPIPQAPEINYSLLSQLLRPANVVDVPMRAAAPMAESIATRPAEEPTLEKAKRKYTRKSKVQIPEAEEYVSELEPMMATAMESPFDISKSGAFSKKEAESMLSSGLEGEFLVSQIPRRKGQKGRIEIGNPELGSRTFQEPSIQRAGASSFMPSE